MLAEHGFPHKSLLAGDEDYRRAGLPACPRNGGRDAKLNLFTPKGVIVDPICSSSD